MTITQDGSFVVGSTNESDEDALTRLQRAFGGQEEPDTPPLPQQGSLLAANGSATSAPSPSPTPAPAASKADPVADMVRLTSTKRRNLLPPGLVPLEYENHSFDLALLFRILMYRRAHGSNGEKQFIRDVLLPTIQALKHEFTLFGPSAAIPEMMNIIVTIPRDDGKASDTLFSCHIDTVHSSTDNTPMQTLAVDVSLEHVFLDKQNKHNGSCLGADDGAGVWMLLEMMRFDVPGTYVFHRGEERGCIGSNWMKNFKGEWLKQFKRAIAFDRKDTCDVITHQRNSECCSNEFASELAELLSSVSDNVTLKPSKLGMFTDTANYVEHIPECTNISVGYEEAHGSSEYLNFGYLQHLLHAALSIDWDTLPTKRVPRPAYSNSYSGVYGGSYGAGFGHRRGHGYGYGKNGYDGYDDDFAGARARAQGGNVSPFPTARGESAAPSPSPSSAPTPSSPTPFAASSAPVGEEVKESPDYEYRFTTLESISEWERSDIVAWIEFCKTPEEIADVIIDLAEQLAAADAALEFRRRVGR